MKSFPSTANESQYMLGSSKAPSYASTFDVSRIKAVNLNASVPVLQEQLKESNINIANYQQATPASKIDLNGMSHATDNKVYYENPLMLPSDVIALAKDYAWQYSKATKTMLSAEKKDDNILIDFSETTIAPSMFNPMYGVNYIGITRNTPLLNFEDMTKEASYSRDLDVDDCSIRTLCMLSKDANSVLGNARYKYADFMYCKDLGKVANNHLITLRKFAHPVPDHIGHGAAPKYTGSTASWAGEGDVGRLVTWFGTDDNKLEDICKYSYSATWKELTAEIQEENSKADDPNTGILGMLSNTLNPLYNTHVNYGSAGTNSVWGWLGSKVGKGLPIRGIESNNVPLFSNYDKNKIYDPKNVVHTTHIYEGKLIFSHEFTLNFSYKIRGYDNINPRSAMLDLIGNVLEVTYRRGKFWRGEHKIIGPPQDTSLFDKASAMIDKSFETVGGFLSTLMSSGFSFQQILGQLGSMAQGALSNIINGAKNIINGNGQEFLNKTIETVTQNVKEGNHLGAAKGLIKNALGRPQLYAWHSLLSGDDVGLWHVTVGNPRNPILSIGNLIMTNATVQHSGPLGIDDFPTELRVSVTLKHAKPRDVTEIGRMYTQGTAALYQLLNAHPVETFWRSGGGASSKQGQNSQTEDDKKAQISADAIAYQTAQEASKNNPQQKDNVGISNPRFNNELEADLHRKNTYSDTILRLMLDETA